MTQRDVERNNCSLEPVGYRHFPRPYVSTRGCGYARLVYYSVYSNISSNISCLRIEHYKQIRILKYSQSRAYGGPGGRATKHCTTSGFLIEQYSDGPIPCSSNGAAVRFCDRSHSAIKRSSTSATALTSIDLFLGSNNGLYLGSNNGLFLRSNSGPFLRPTSQTYYGIYRWYLA